jgi:sporulation protein YlmC with PRC-barrel domain
MLASLTELRSYYVKNAQGEIGRIEDLCFREDEWIVRYVVVGTEDLGREVLLLSAHLGPADRATHTVAADIRRDQVENTPPLDRTQPLTRQDEQELHDLYGWPVYWWEQEQEITPIEGLWEEPEEPPEEAGEPLGGSAQEEEGPQILFVSDLTEVYGIQSDDGEVGILQDVIVDDETWVIAYLVVQAQPSGHRTLLASDYIQTTDLAARDIHVAMSREAIGRSPALASDEPITPDLVQSLHEYYDQYAR